MADIYAQDPRVVKSIVGNQAYNYGGDVLGSADGYGIGSTYGNLPTTGSYQGTAGYAAANYDDIVQRMQKELAGSNATAKAIQAQLAAAPRLPTFDYSANMSKAQGVAASTVNPVYQDKLNRYLEKNATLRNQQTVATTRSKEDIASALAQSLEDSALGRTRTNEDATTKIGDITANENSYQTQEGRQFDQARSALLGDVANAGLTESGLGQGIAANATTDRNLKSADQVREYDAAKRDTETFRNRTLADLDTTDTRQKGSAARSTENQDITLRNFIENQGIDERDTRANLETERTLAINDATSSAYKGLVAQTIAALAGSGARSQDIALFKQIYG